MIRPAAAVAKPNNKTYDTRAVRRKKFIIKRNESFKEKNPYKKASLIQERQNELFCEESKERFVSHINVDLAYDLVGCVH